MISFDINEAADFLKLHPNTLQKKAKSGEVPARKVGRRWVFIREHLADYVSGRYAYQRESLRVIDGGKTIQENAIWQSTNKKTVKATTGTSTSQAHVASEYASLLGLKTNNKHKSCTTD
jgi:excisionase family DNA binding protein